MLRQSLIVILALLVSSSSLAIAAPQFLTKLEGWDRDKCDRPDVPPDKTISFCTVMIRMGIENPSGAYHYPHTAIANQTLHAGLAFRQKGDEDAANKYFVVAVLAITEKLKKYPTDAALLGERCWIRAVANIELEEGLKDCEDSIKFKSTDPETLRNYGFILYRKSKYQEALDAYTSSLKLRADDPYALFLRGADRLKLGDATASEDLNAAKDRNRMVPLIFRNYGVVPN